MYCTSGGRENMTFPFFSVCSLPPKSGLNRMSYPFISLSTVSFTRGILLGSLISLTLGREKGGVMQNSLLISHARHAFKKGGYMTCKTEDKRCNWDYLWAQTKVTSKEKVKIPKWFFLILPIAIAFEVVSRCEWGERTSNLLQTVQRSQWEAHACSQPKIKEWRLMMVDEQFPLQRKILKGQVVVRNEETSVCARSEMNNNGVNF